MYKESSIANVVRGFNQAVKWGPLKIPYAISNYKGLYDLAKMVNHVPGINKITKPITNVIDSTAHGIGQKVLQSIPEQHRGLAVKGLKGFEKITDVQNLSDLATMATDFVMPEKQQEKIYDTQKKIKNLQAPLSNRVGHLKSLDNQITFSEKTSSFIDIDNLRVANYLEKPFLIDRVLDLKDKFLISDHDDLDLLIKNFFCTGPRHQQETLVSGDLQNLHGFINYGLRPMINEPKNSLYIRIVYVNPKQQGQGLGQKLVTEAIKQASKEWNFDNIWLQTCPDNYSMKKVASRLGFNHVTSYNYNNHVAEVWSLNYGI